MSQYKKGFTLIELLVVIAIIGILASVVLSSLGQARASARDAKRISEIRQFQTALELFRNANNGVYPCSTGNLNNSNNRIALLDGSARTGSSAGNNRPAGCSDMRPYMSSLPVDPTFTGTNDYLYRSFPPQNGTGYNIRIRRESNDDFCVIVSDGDWSIVHSNWQIYPSCY
ncbi:MAG: type II secretion system protein [Candidatus Paceibacteria bacterium]